MEKFFVNHTNHASANWCAEQLAAAESYGKIIDIPFPEVPPEFSTEEVGEIVSDNLQKILELAPAAVLCQGEFSYTVAMVELLKAHNIPVLAATSQRVVSEIANPDGSTRRVSIFKFVRFRNY